MRDRRATQWKKEDQASRQYREDEEKERALPNRENVWLYLNGIDGCKLKEASVLCGLAIAKNTFPLYDEPWSVIHITTGDILVSFYFIDEAIDARMELIRICPHIATLDYQDLRNFERDIMGHSILSQFPNRR